MYTIWDFLYNILMENERHWPVRVKDGMLGDIVELNGWSSTAYMSLTTKCKCGYFMNHKRQLPPCMKEK